MNMRTDLNFEAESFAGYDPTQGEDSEQFMNKWMSGGLRHSQSHGPHHGGFRHRFRRWPWLQTGFGFGGLAQDPQSVAWAQGCLSQITGNMIPQTGHLDMATRSAIRMFQTQQQLPATGVPDDATMAALQAACGAQGGQDQDTGEIARPIGYGRSPVGPGATPSAGAAKSDRRILWFELNSIKLRQDNEADSAVHLALVVGESLRHLKAKGNAAKIILYGYASREGAEDRNTQLAGQRAEHVKEMLVVAGVPENRIQIVNGGPNNDWPGLKWNRRVEVELQPQP
jgi:outer membrane protein OmpA-like peptidoglycan-associated protein